MHDPLLSVIVPVYNAQDYLRECLDSILTSSYKKLEVILVNDGSIDGSLSICQEYAVQDKRVTVLSQENRGISAARNHGMEYAHGTYIAFVDADDFLSPVSFELCVQTMEQEQVDLVGFEHTSSVNALTKSTDGILDRIRILDGWDSILSALASLPETRKYTWTFCMVWNKLYRRSKITCLFDTECTVGEDMLFNWMYARNCSKMALIPMIGYFYRENESSITRLGHNNKKNRHSYNNKIADAKVWSRIAQDTRNITPRLQNYLNARSTYNTHQALWRLASGKVLAEYPEFVAFAREYIKANWLHLLKEKDCELSVRVMAVLCRMCYPLWLQSAKILGK